MTGLTPAKNPPTKILIVDDNPDIRHLLRLTFSDEKYQLFEAINGNECLAIASRQKPDVILLDIMMPGHLDGLSVCDYLKASELKNISIVLLTAKNQKQDVLEGFDVGADAYFSKPFSPSALIDCVDKLAKTQKLAHKGLGLLRQKFLRGALFGVLLCVFSAIAVGVYTASTLMGILSYFLLSVSVVTFLMYWSYRQESRSLKATLPE